MVHLEPKLPMIMVWDMAWAGWDMDKDGKAKK